MSGDPDNIHKLAPAWNARQVVVFNGQHDTRISAGTPYETRSLASLFALEPGNADKLDGLAFIPSTYNAHDARNHATQRADGSFVALCGDVDHGDHPLDRIEAMVRGFAGEAAWLIFSTAHARADDKRWRIVIPLAQPMGFEDWHDAQHAFFNFMEYGGVEMDRALDRAGQPVYLPNVPDHHAKTGEILRNDDGTPVFYKRATTGTNAPGLKNDGQLAAGMAAIARKREEDERERAQMREEAAKRRANRPRNDDAPIMEDFNRGNPVANLLELYGYKQSPRNSADWRSPHQQGDSYATRIVEDSWISLSASDVSSGLGQKCRAGCFGDAYDLFVHYEHSGDHKSAFRTLYQERRAGQPQTYSAPPAIDPDDPGPDMMDDYEPLDAEEAVEVMETEAAVIAADGEEWGELDLVACSAAPAPEREWVIDGWVPTNKTTLSSGDGGVGKSLLEQQKATCVAMGIPFFGLETRRMNAAYLSWEDDAEELWRRQQDICATLHIPMASLAGRLHLVSLTEEESPFVVVSSDDQRGVAVTPLGSKIERLVDRHDIGLLILDNASQIAGIDHNSTDEVTPFGHFLSRLAKRRHGAVVLLHHTNKAGADYLGSVAYNNAFRSRTLIARPEDGIDPDVRIWTNPKANYSQAGGSIEFRWHKGAFVRDDDLPPNQAAEMAANVKASAANLHFLAMLDECLANKRAVSHVRGTNYAPTIFYRMPNGKKFAPRDYEDAMERLIHLGEIRLNEPLFQDAHRKWKQGIQRTKNCGDPPADTPCGDLRRPHSQPIENTCGDLRAATPPISKDIEGGPLGAGPPSEENSR